MTSHDPGWWLSPTPLKNDGVKVSWDDYSIPNMMGKSCHPAMFQSPPTVVTVTRNDPTRFLDFFHP